jgi:hypothetical protein
MPAMVLYIHSGGAKTNSFFLFMFLLICRRKFEIGVIAASEE